MSYFCEICGSLLDKNKCLNPNCKVKPKKKIEHKKAPHISEEPRNSTAKISDLSDHINQNYHLESKIPFKTDSFRILCFSDWRVQSMSLIRKFVKSLTPPADIIIYAGDDTERFIEFQDEIDPSTNQRTIRRNYFEELAKYSSFGLFAIIGNDCPSEMNDLIQGKKVVNLNAEPIICENFVLFGLSGAESIDSDLSRSIEEGVLPTNIGNNFSTHEEYQKRLEQLSSAPYSAKFKIIVSHSPPFQCLDLARRYGLVFLGSKALRQQIELDNTIKLVVCGHVHLFGAKSLPLNRSIVVNCASHDTKGSFGVIGIIDIARKTGEVNNIIWRFLAPPLQKLVWGIGFTYDTILKAAGYNRLEDFLDHDLMNIHHNTGQRIGRTRLKNFRFHAHAVKTGEQVIDILSLKTSVETLQRSILIDIESDPKFKEIICIGLLFKNNYTYFFLNEPNNFISQKNMLVEFIDFLKSIKKEHGKLGMYCYSGGDSDFGPIERSLRHHQCPVSIFNFFPKSDLLKELTSIAFLPVPNYKLTTLANYLGYKAISKFDFDGLILCSEYYSTFSPQFHSTTTQKQDIKQKIISKNEHDLRKMMFFWTKLFSSHNRKNKKKITR